MTLAHGVGGGQDLPIPASYAVVGGALALAVSFAVLMVAWRRPRYLPSEGGRPAPRWVAAVAESRVVLTALRALALAGLGFATWALVAGPDEVAVNPVFGLVYVLLWVGLVPASLLLGPVVRTVSPARTLHLLLARALRREPDRAVARLPGRVGLWPAALGLLAFTWLELVSPDGTTLRAIGTWFAAYFVVLVVGAFVFGRRWFASADPFEAYSTLVAHLSLWSRDGSGELQVVSPLRNLARVELRPGLVAAVSVLLGSTAFDSFRDSVTWLQFRQRTARDLVVLETGLLVLACLAVGLLFAAATVTATPARGRRASLPTAFALSLVPIVLGYMVAHYLTLLVETGQQTLILASDPLGNGSDLFGTAERRVDLWLSLHPTFLASVKVLAIVAGHVVGAVAAHDRALVLLRSDRLVRGQLPLLSVMVAFTATGLALLFGV
ncbi:hypothetical protein [Nocardioides coralli]|uniref:hypothetical protein n=1 Tax=Nocardioides coralli TaxID=2872154 RepID=UPI002017A6FD|nr:hypothetical protein [Nocardioides coralli]